MWLIPALLVAALLIWSGCAGALGEDGGSDSKATSQILETNTKTDQGTWGDVTFGLGHFVFGAHYLDPSSTPGDPLAVDPYGVQLSQSEFPPGASPTEMRYEEYSTSYRVWGVDLLWTKHLLVYGQRDSGGSVVELWTLPPVTGEWRAEATPSGTAVGVPIASKPEHTEFLVGGTYVPQASRERRGRIRRREVYSGSSLGVLSACVDRDLRCVYMLGRDSAGAVGLYLVDLSNLGLKPQLVLDPATYPELVSAESLSEVLGPGIGRGLLVDLDRTLDPEPAKKRDLMIVWDDDNDAIPDRAESFTDDDFWAKYPDGTFDYTPMSD